MTTNIQHVGPGSEAVASYLDFPPPGRVNSAFVLIAGWFVLPGKPSDAHVSVCLREFDNKVLGAAPAGERVDVRGSLPPGDASIPYGYEFRIHRFDLPPKFNLDIWVSFRDGEASLTDLLGTVTGTNEPNASVAAPRLTPLYVVGLGRSGTTALVRMVGSHPAVACGMRYPLELCISTYHAKLARIASSTANLQFFSMPRLFSPDQLVGPNPFGSMHQMDARELDDALLASSDTFSRAAVEANEAWYDILTRDRPNKRAAAFVEKSVPNSALINALNVYPDARCIILTRDPREIFLSRIRFNKKRGTLDFGEQIATDKQHWAEMHARECRSLMRIHDAFRSRIVRTIRYEDLMLEPSVILADLCNALGLGAEPASIDGMVAAGRDQSGQFAAHRTSGDESLADERREHAQLLEAMALELRDFFDRYGYSA